MRGERYIILRCRYAFDVNRELRYRDIEGRGVPVRPSGDGVRGFHDRLLRWDVEARTVTIPEGLQHLRYRGSP